MTKMLQSFLALGLVCIFLFFVLITFLPSSLEFCGFGVDSNESIYIGRSHQIEIYENGVRTSTIIPPVERGWCMRVDASDKIIVSDMGNIYTLDLQGTLIDQQEDSNSSCYYEVREFKRYEHPSGNVYELKHRWIFPVILKNGEVIYRVPFADFIARISFLLGVVCTLIGAFFSKRNHTWFK